MAARWTQELCSMVRVSEIYTRRKLVIRWAKLRPKDTSHVMALDLATSNVDIFKCNGGAMHYQAPLSSQSCRYSLSCPPCYKPPPLSCSTKHNR